MSRTELGFMTAEPSEWCWGEYHETSLDDNAAFEALLRRHGLEYAGGYHRYNPTNPFVWIRRDGALLVSAGANPITGEHHVELEPGSTVNPGDLSYVRVQGEFAFAKPLWDDIAESCVWNKGTIRPLAPVGTDTGSSADGCLARTTADQDQDPDPDASATDSGEGGDSR